MLAMLFIYPGGAGAAGVRRHERGLSDPQRLQAGGRRSRWVTATHHGLHPWRGICRWGRSHIQVYYIFLNALRKSDVKAK